ncbi:MAG: galactokinase [Rikenellaceae bacterium]|nr:galactokinase [Rikenellaceae bacterium]
MIEKINDAFKKYYGSEGELYTSPGRVNIIGEHTDYNFGYVLPGAIDKAIYAKIKPNGERNCRIYSVDYNDSAEFSVDSNELPKKQWGQYIYGVIKEIQKLGKRVEGFDFAFGGDVPLGAGLSSSAALESVVGFAISEAFGLGLSRFQLAKVGQMCEHNYVGVRCGIMDQFASLFGQKDKVIQLDCRTLDYKLYPFNLEGYKVVLLDSQVKHSLASSEYNVRRAQCEEGVITIQKHVNGIESLRDVNLDMLNTYKNEMEEIVYRRCKFVIDENQRVLDACSALEKGDSKTMGEKMFGSHQGLSKDYEVSCPELDFLAEYAKNYEGVIGSRMMGGGFGGCTINIVKESDYDGFIHQITDRYNSQFGRPPRVIDVVISDGARKL